MLRFQEDAWPGLPPGAAIQAADHGAAFQRGLRAWDGALPRLVTTMITIIHSLRCCPGWGAAGSAPPWVPGSFFTPCADGQSGGVFRAWAHNDTRNEHEDPPPSYVCTVPPCLAYICTQRNSPFRRATDSDIHPGSGVTLDPWKPEATHTNPSFLPNTTLKIGPPPFY